MKLAPDEVPRFIADAMLGRLARWLRLLGYDTVYEPRISDDELASRSLRERRVILTNDKKVSRRRSLRVIHIPNERIQDQILRVMKEMNLRLRVKSFFTRCSRCNRLLEAVEKSRVSDKVPPRVCDRYVNFCRCPECKKIYWSGSHWEHFLRALEQTVDPVRSSS